MRGNLRIMALPSIGCAAIVLALAGTQGVSVVIDGKSVVFPNAQPQIIEGRTMVPFRGVLEELGATVTWDPSNRKVTAHRSDRHIEMFIGQRTAQVDGRNVTLDVPAMILQSTTMVPLRFMSENLGASVLWLADSRTVKIDSTAVVHAKPQIVQPAKQVFIKSFVVGAPDAILVTGSRLNLELIGTPGARVVFLAPNYLKPVRLVEVEPGIYRTTWVVPANMNNQRESIILARLVSNGQTVTYRIR